MMLLRYDGGFFQGDEMRTFLIACCCLLLAACGGGQMTRHHKQDKPRSVFIEGFGELDTYRELYDFAGIALARRGYDATTDEKRATYRMRTSLQWSFLKVYVALRLVDVDTGQVVYFGECNNPFSGSQSSARDCFVYALENLE